MTEKTKGFLSLRFRFVVVLLLAILLAFSAAFLTQFAGKQIITRVYLEEERTRQRCHNLMDQFEEFVTANDLSVRQAQKISDWVRTKRFIYLVISRGDQVLIDSGWWNNAEYYSAFEDPDAEIQVEGDDSEEAESVQPDMLDQGIEVRTIPFAEGRYQVTLYDFTEEPLYWIVQVGSYVVGILFLLIIMLGYHHSVIRRIIKLTQQVEEVAQGNLQASITEKSQDEIGMLAAHLNTMRDTIMKQMRAEQEAWNANSDLITRMSHDIRTPLTVLLGFLEVLDEGKYSDNEVYQGYLNICMSNAYQLKELADKLFQYFLVFGHRSYEIKMEIVDARTLLGQLVGEHALLLQEQGWNVKLQLLKQSADVKADPVYLKRLFDNLFSNIEKYADPAKTVVLSMVQEKERIHVSVKNEIKPVPNPVESTEIGLKTSERIVQLMEGSFRVKREKQTFSVEIWLPVCREQEEDRKDGETPALPE